mmetsp:Transcript_14242/g.17298  ORF Transcript_14242/g.17298 Transcript_14242/m.17298 type:complete len:809 (-) Transcript_14242:48-2474(-)
MDDSNQRESTSLTPYEYTNQRSAAAASSSMLSPTNEQQNRTPSSTMKHIKPALRKSRRALPISCNSSPAKSTQAQPSNLSLTGGSSSSFFGFQEGDDSWRKDGKILRKQLIEEDDAAGGSEFVINKQSKLRNYCDIADRVRDQFQATFEAGNKLEEAYIMGNRLIKFLGDVLPTHHHYYSRHPEYTKLRIKTQNCVLEVRKQIDEVAFLYDKEIYRSVMETQGLEFSASPEKTSDSVARRRKKRVTFALEQDYLRHEKVMTVTPEKNEKGLVSKTKDVTESLKRCKESTSSPLDEDLSLWEQRDPGMEIINLTMSSESDGEDETSFHLSSDSIELVAANSSHEKEIASADRNVKYDDMFDMHAEVDGWSSFQVDECDFEWPEITLEGSEEQSCVQPRSTDSDSDYIIGSVQQSTNNEDNYVSDDDSESEASENFEEVSVDYEYDDEISLSSRENISFVEKIARENCYRGINELHLDEDDSDAVDSWEQGDDLDDAEEDDTSKQSVHSEGGIDNADESDVSKQSINQGDIHEVAEQELQDGYEDEDCVSNQEETSKGNDTPETPKSLEENTCNISQIHDDEEQRNFCDISNLDEQSFEKTILTSSTIETDGTSGDEGSEESDKERSLQNNSVIGIVRREPYSPSFDSPDRTKTRSPRSHDNRELPIKLDYLECKVKGLLQEKNDNRAKLESVEWSISTTFPQSVGNSVSSLYPDADIPIRSGIDENIPKTSYPLQMARQSFEPLNTSKSTSQNLSIHKPLVKEVTNTHQLNCNRAKVSYQNEIIKPHPTAARLKNLRKTAAWKRRFGKE